MPSTDEIVIPLVPPALWKFLQHACGLETSQLQPLPGGQMP